MVAIALCQPSDKDAGSIFLQPWLLGITCRPIAASGSTAAAVGTTNVQLLVKQPS